jgi:hypothetical protein
MYAMWPRTVVRSGCPVACPACPKRAALFHTKRRVATDKLGGECARGIRSARPRLSRPPSFRPLQAGPEADGDAEHASWVRAGAAALSSVAEGLYLNEVMHDQPGNAQVRVVYERYKERKTYARCQASLQARYHRM